MRKLSKTMLKYRYPFTIHYLLDCKKKGVMMQTVHHYTFFSTLFRFTFVFIFHSRFLTVVIGEASGCLILFFPPVCKIGLKCAHVQPASASLICQDFSKITDSVAMISLLSTPWQLPFQIFLGGFEFPLWQWTQEKKWR